MTHIENISHILEHGITHLNSPNTNPSYTPIGDKSIISKRADKVIPNGKKLSDYIPFYFGSSMPMLYVIQKGFNGVSTINAQKIIYLITSVEQILNQNLEFVFTDGHAVDSFSSFYNATDIDKIDDIIDKKAIENQYWKDEHDLDLKRRKEAEFLVAKDIPKEAILGFVVYDELTKQELISLGVNEKVVVIRPKYYF
jgi:ssDNA thymidine ADP-ribosyltransferase, DarT